MNPTLTIDEKVNTEFVHLFHIVRWLLAYSVAIFLIIKRFVMHIKALSPPLFTEGMFNFYFLLYSSWFLLQFQKISWESSTYEFNVWYFTNFLLNCLNTRLRVQVISCNIMAPEHFIVKSRVNTKALSDLKINWIIQMLLKYLRC